MPKRFFKPYYNYNNYKLGLLNNIKVLVLGASFYCTYNKKSDKYQCPEWEKCTSKKNKDSSSFNKTCPYYNDKEIRVYLEDIVTSEINDYLKGCKFSSYDNFTDFMVEYTSLNKEKLWGRIAFTNYVQYFLPSFNTPSQTKDDIRNFEAFLETLEELKPDIIIVWGTRITDHFKRKYIKRIVDKLEMRENSYLYDMSYNNRNYILVNPYHPCYNEWSGFKQALDIAFDEIAKNRKYIK